DDNAASGLLEQLVGGAHRGLGIALVADQQHRAADANGEHHEQREDRDLEGDAHFSHLTRDPAGGPVGPKSYFVALFSRSSTASQAGAAGGASMRITSQFAPSSSRREA